MVYDWVAFKGAANRLAIGSYAGDGVDNRSITVGFRPDYLIVLSSQAYQPVQRFLDQVGDASFTFADGATLTNEIQSFAGNGFTVGNADEVNKASTNYYYVAWKIINGRIQTGSYAGNAADNRAITTPAFTPYALFLTSGLALRAPIQRLAPVIGTGPIRAAAAQP